MRASTSVSCLKHEMGGGHKGVTPAHIKRRQDIERTKRMREDRLRDAKADRSDAELIAQALAEGRLTRLEPGPAQGVLKWGAFGHKVLS
jgi:hypothetical protein